MLVRGVWAALGEKGSAVSQQITGGEHASPQALRRAVEQARDAVARQYESLWRAPYPKADLLVTLGSPLALPGGVFDMLDHGGLTERGARPPGVRRWVNLAEVGDLIAVPRPLSDRFDGVHTDDAVHMARVDCHTMGMYLSCGMVAAAIAPYLGSSDELTSSASVD